MKKRLVLITLIVATVAAVPLFIYAGPGKHLARGMHGMHGGGMHGMGFLAHLSGLRDELDLTDAQVDQLKSIMRETHEQNAHFRGEIHNTFKSVATTLLTNPNDVAGAQAVLDRQEANEKELKKNLLVAASKALNVLTPEQRTKLALHMAERANRWENHGR